MKRFEFLISIPGRGLIRHFVQEVDEEQAKAKINRAYPNCIPHFLDKRKRSTPEKLLDAYKNTLGA